MRVLKKIKYLCGALMIASLGMSLVVYADTEITSDTFEYAVEERTSEEQLLEGIEMPLLMARDTRALPTIPGDSEVLTNVFRNPIGTGPVLLTDKILRITPAKNGQKGAIWSKHKLDLKRNFTLKAYLYLGDSFQRAADGITFTLQNDGRMVSSPNSVIGDGGMGIGVYSNKLNNPYVRNAISIEFDTFYNGSGNYVMDTEIGENGKKGHIAFATPSNNNNKIYGEHSGITKANEYLSNGKWRNISFKWDAATQVLSYDLENVGTGSHKITNLNSQFGGDEVYWGFTASTGGYNAENAIAISELPQNFEQEPTVENITQSIAKAERVTGDKGDTVQLETVIKRSPFSQIELYDNSTVQVNIADGLTPKLDEIKINNTLVSSNRIEFNNGILKIKKLNLSPTGQDTISVVCTVTSNQYNVALENFFELVTASNSVVSTSSSIFVDIPKVKIGKVIVTYIELVNGQEVDLKPSKTISKNIGEPYKAEKLVIPEYDQVSIIGNEEGTITAETQYVKYIYEPTGVLEITSFPKLIDFGEILVSDYQKKVSADKTNVDKPLVVEDTRRQKDKWDVTLTVTQELTNNANPSKIDVQTGALKYYYDGNEITLDNVAQRIYFNDSTSTNKKFNISDEWGKGDLQEGLKLKIDSARVPNTTGSYVGKIKWTLRDTLE